MNFRGCRSPSAFDGKQHRGHTMNRLEQQSLFSERAALERMIAETPAEDVIDLRSLSVRLEIINRALAHHSIETRFPAKARLTFRRRPVVGSHGIFAEFGMTATKGVAQLEMSKIELCGDCTKRRQPFE